MKKMKIELELNMMKWENKKKLVKERKKEWKIIMQQKNKIIKFL